MKPVHDNAITQMEQGLLKILKEEYSFYQTMYILLDKQRDLIRYNKEESILDLYAEVERCQRRIQESEEKVAALRQHNPKMFRVAALHPDIKKMINSIVTLVKKNVKLVEENESYVRDRHDRIKIELSELKNSGQILKYLDDSDPSPLFIDGRK
jgi:hypothetical protein